MLPLVSVLVVPEAVRVLSKAAKVGPVAPIAHQVLDGARELRGAFARHGQVVIDLLAQPAECVGGDDADPGFCRMVGAAAMPGGTEVKKCTALLHYRLHRGAIVR